MLIVTNKYGHPIKKYKFIYDTGTNTMKLSLIHIYAAVSLSAPVSAAKAADVSLTVTVHNAAMFGASRVRVKLRLQNLLTGESENKTVWLAVDRRTKADALSSFVPCLLYTSQRNGSADGKRTK